MGRIANKDLLRKTNILWERPHREDKNGFQICYHFENGFGASVVRYYTELSSMNIYVQMGSLLGSLFGEDLSFNYSHGYDEGLWEIATVKFRDDESFGLVTTNLFDGEDVKGFLTEKQVNNILKKIENSDFEILEEGE